MQILKGLQYSKSDFVHDDEVVQIEDTATGRKYQMFLRRPDPAGNGSLCLVIPRSICKNLSTTERSIVIELGEVNA